MGTMLPCSRADLVALAGHIGLTLPPVFLRHEEHGEELYHRFIWQFCKIYIPENILELGTWRGMSAMCMAEGNPDAKIITIDNNGSELRQLYKRNAVKYVIADSLKDQDIDDIELLFIDTDHNGRCLQEYEFWSTKVVDGGVILFDDIHLNHMMENFWNDFNPKGVKFELPLHGPAGFGVVIHRR